MTVRHSNPEDAPTLFDAPPVYVTPPFAPRASIEERFRATHAANPWLATLLHRLAVDMLNRGHSRLGIGMLWEVARYELLRATEETRAVHLDNSLRSRYARLLTEMDPRLDGVFELRKLRESA